MTAFVVDASVAVKWFVTEEGSDRAEALAASGRRLISPGLLMLEVASAFNKKARSGQMTVEGATDRLAALPRYLNEIVDHRGFLPSAFRLALDLDHHLYDCVYLELARRRDAAMVTDDRRLVEKVQRHGLSRLAVALADWRIAVT